MPPFPGAELFFEEGLGAVDDVKAGGEGCEDSQCFAYHCGRLLCKVGAYPANINYGNFGNLIQLFGLKEGGDLLEGVGVEGGVGVAEG